MKRTNVKYSSGEYISIGDKVYLHQHTNVTGLIIEKNGEFYLKTVGSCLPLKDVNNRIVKAD